MKEFLPTIIFKRNKYKIEYMRICKIENLRAFIFKLQSHLKSGQNFYHNIKSHIHET